MEQVEPLVALVRIDGQNVVDVDDLWRAFLPRRVEINLNASQIKLQHRGSPLDALDHKGGHSREQKFQLD
ncbi:hypothetical protein [Mesorhizobium tianshanense]|uniref:hypothetical protein n=1 Tax=Mesorhizobium tianshanense TaxID=39844 RepID=UPI002ADD692F|nr:hypothetical protein [Mesorhizobium tianshanense]